MFSLCNIQINFVYLSISFYFIKRRLNTRNFILLTVFLPAILLGQGKDCHVNVMPCSKVPCYLSPVKKVQDTMITIMPEKCNDVHFDSTNNGIWKIYLYDDTTLLEVVRIKWGKKNGTDIIFYNNKTINEKATYKNGKLNGDYISFFEDGKVHMKGYYTTDNSSGFHSFTGKETKFWDNGKIAYKAIWKNGSYKEEDYWDAEGKKIDEEEWNKLWCACN